MIMKTMIFFMLATLLLGTPAVAKTGAALKDMCESGSAAQPNEMGAGFCLGAITSILEVMKDGNSIGGMNACFPPDLSTQDAIDTVMQYLDKYDLSKFRLYSAVALIFSHEFSCN